MASLIQSEGFDILELSNFCVKTQRRPTEAFPGKDYFFDEGLKDTTIREINDRVYHKGGAFLLGPQLRHYYYDKSWEPFNLFHVFEYLDDRRDSIVRSVDFARRGFQESTVNGHNFRVFYSDQKIEKAQRKILLPVMTFALGMEAHRLDTNVSFHCFEKAYVQGFSKSLLLREIEQSININITRLYRQALVPSSREVFCKHLGVSKNLLLENNETRVVIIQRRRSRIILNAKLIMRSLTYLGISNSLVYLEDHTVEEQFVIMQNATTLIGVHGAGLSWARFLHPRSAVIQLSPYPCHFDIHSPVSFGFQIRYGIVQSSLRATSPFINVSDANTVCSLLEMIRNSRKQLTEEEDALHKLFSHEVRFHDVTVDIPGLIEGIRNLDSVLERRNEVESRAYKLYMPRFFPSSA